MGEYNFGIDPEEGKVYIKTPNELEVVVDDKNQEIIIGIADEKLKITSDLTEIINDKIQFNGDTHPIALGDVVSAFITAYNGHTHTSDGVKPKFEDNPESELVFVDS